MTYKDSKQAAQASKERMRRMRSLRGYKMQGVTKGVTNTGCNTQGVTLHPAIIAGIDRLSTNADGTVDESERSRRMAIATDYERLYPGRPYTGTGIAPK